MATLPVLKRFQQRIFKLGAGGGLEPDAGATVKLYRVGATATTQTTVPAAPSVINVPVFEIGTIVQGEQLQNGAAEAEVMEVTTIVVSPPAIQLKSLTGSAIVVPQFGRLIRKDSPIAAFEDPVATEVKAPLTSVDDGWAEAYIAEYRYDYTVTGGGVTPAAYPDAEGSWVMR